MGKGPKTKRTAAKRFKITGKGKALRQRAGNQHYFAAKSPKRLQSLEGNVEVADSDLKTLKRLLPGRF